MPCKPDKPWERQSGESSQAYEAFSVYLNMGSDRSIRAVTQKLHKSYTIIARWSRDKNWQDRVRAYDSDVEKQVRAQAIKDRKSMIDRHIKIAMQVQKKALQALDSLKVEEMSPKDIKEYIRMATDLERLSRTLGNDESEANKAKSLTGSIVSDYESQNGNAGDGDVIIYLPDDGRGNNDE